MNMKTLSFTNPLIGFSMTQLHQIRAHVEPNMQAAVISQYNSGNMFGMSIGQHEDTWTPRASFALRSLKYAEANSHYNYDKAIGAATPKLTRVTTVPSVDDAFSFKLVTMLVEFGKANIPGVLMIPPDIGEIVYKDDAFVLENAGFVPPDIILMVSAAKYYLEDYFYGPQPIRKYDFELPVWAFRRVPLKADGMSIPKMLRPGSFGNRLLQGGADLLSRLGLSERYLPQFGKSRALSSDEALRLRSHKGETNMLQAAQELTQIQGRSDGMTLANIDARSAQQVLRYRPMSDRDIKRNARAIRRTLDRINCNLAPIDSGLRSFWQEYINRVGSPFHYNLGDNSDAARFRSATYHQYTPDDPEFWQEVNRRNQDAYHYREDTTSRGDGWAGPSQTSTPEGDSHEYRRTERPPINYFEVLGLKPAEQYDRKVIMAAFRTRLKQVHPDKLGNPEDKEVKEKSNRATQMVAEAKEMLLDPVKCRKHYKMVTGN